MNTDGGFYEFNEKSGRSHCSCHVSVNDELSKWINYRNDMADIYKWDTNALFVNINGERLLERGVDGIFVSSFAVWGLRGWESVEVCLDGKVWRLRIF